VTAYWCEWAWLGGDSATAAVLVRVDGDRIASVHSGAPPPADATVLSGLTLPGLANVHSHAFHRALRGRTQREPGGRPGSFWTWRERMYALAGRLTPETYLPLATAALAEMALAGVTAVGEFHYLHHGPDGRPYADPNEMGRVLLAAAAEAGVRITLLDTCYLHGGVDRPAEGVQRRFSDGSAGAWAERVEGLAGGPSVRVGAAAHSVRAVDPASIAAIAAYAAGRDMPCHVHLSEQPAENADCLARYGTTPTALLDRAGALTARTTAVHATHLSAGDRALLAASGASVCLCPTTERDLADGIGPAAALRDAGVALSLGSDSHAVVDLLEEARAVELDERLATGARGHFGATELLRAATEAGARALGWHAGRIAPGRLADLSTVDIGGVRLAGAGPEHLLDAVVFAGTAADVTHTVLGGEPVVVGGGHRRVGDVAAALRAAIAAVS
jgi:formiminoglutamate deiminase